MSGALTFPEAFAQKMPLELKQMVFNQIAIGDTNDIEIKLADEYSQTLESPVLDLLADLKRWYPEDVYIAAIYYFTGLQFRWVFVSDHEPYRKLFRIFRKQIPIEVRERIKHIYLRRVRLASLMNQVQLLFNSLPHSDETQLPHISDYPRYLQPIVEKLPQVQGLDIFHAILLEIRSAMLLLPHAIPSLDKLDLGLEISDCLITLHSQGKLYRYSRFISQDTGTNAIDGLVITLSPLKTIANISQLNIRIIWDSNLEHDTKRIKITDKKEEYTKNSVIKALHKEIPAKSITGHV
ncbi:hypothetical protein ACJQWK_06045 [Exserohilum turcicum]|uniref:Uncharacterized protein n=1 Tax=Exserohilum turcicum (strain 28A) TaxID=671987 RepID=R0K7Y7_EXST2|nr:uncharacterized protein SETTUDRAFT_38383 [Exserohilum turcica Et28A]EOA89078.1 hypothetical protein SETTUDRAFT_38383 [Exserohilum turcica Et28A]